MTRFHLAGGIAAALALAGCEPAAAPVADAAANTAAPGQDYLARIFALSPGQQQLVLFRAIRDAGQVCQGISAVTRGPDTDGRANWRVSCRGDATWAVAIGNDGIAQVTGPVAAGRR